MEFGWGAPLADDTDGLDILGVRGLDQAIEASLVVGITTISQRGRYLTILPWALGEFFSADAESGAEAYDPDRLKAYLFRVQFLTLACTVADPSPGDESGLLGRVSYRTDVARLRRGEPIPFPMSGAGAMLGTYFGPCSALGLTRNGPAGRPYVVTRRGKAIWEARNQAQSGARVADFLRDAQEITPDAARRFAPHFSLESLDETPAEAALLREALLTPWTPNDPAQAAKVKSAYDRSTSTLEWLRGEAQESLSAEALLNRQLARTVRSQDAKTSVPLTWAEFEWRRRLHFALELIMAAVSQTLAATGSATIGEIVSAWVADPYVSEFFREVWPEVTRAADRSGREAVDSVPRELGLNGLSSAWSRLAAPSEQALAGFALLSATTRQGSALRESGLFPDREGRGEQALAVIDQAGEEPFFETIQRVTHVVVRAHLTTTFGKMERGQKCSLRFFPEGPRLRSTGQSAGAGRSGSRLGNMIKILQDAAVDGMRESA